MLTRLLAPADFFSFGSRNIPQLFPNGTENAKSVPVLKPLSTNTAGPAINTGDALYSAERTTARSIEYNLGMSIEDFVSKFIAARNSESSENSVSSAKSLQLDFSTRYSFNKTTNSRPEDGGTRICTISGKEAVSRYRASGSVRTSARDRSSKLDLFYRQSEKVESRISTQQVQSYRGVRNKIAAEFTYNFSLDFSMLRQFNDQTMRLNEHGDEAVAGYLDTTGRLLDTSVQSVKSFFNAVDSMLDSSRANFMKRVEKFFNDLKAAYGEDAAFLDRDKQAIVQEATGFFDSVQQALDKAEANTVKTLEAGKKSPQVPHGEPEAAPQPEATAQAGSALPEAT